MMKWIPVVLILAMTACTSSTPVHYYQLPTAQHQTVISGASLARPIWVESVTVPDYLAGNGVVYQSSDVQYVIATSNRWASPLDQQLQQVLISNLNADLPGAVVSSAPRGQQYDVLNITVTGFHGRYDGKAVVSGEWLLQRDEQLYRRTFMYALPQSEDGYDALIRTLAQGWQHVSTQIANRLVQQR